MNSESDPDRLFHEAKELASADRAEFLEKSCAGDVTLRARVEKLLADEASAEAYFADTRPSGPAPLVPGRELPAEREGEWIGRYRLLQRIGEGGFGSVWMAEQTEPVTRRVALKVIKFGMDTREVIARFEAERQALAMMDHPNIAKVFDAGATEKGRPFFVMELVKGLPLTEFCDSRKLDTRERLELFAEICAALSHAHQKGIIHRDLKPSNILVTLHGDKPVPKVIDFGIAKATQAKLTDRTLFTRFEQFVGTPVYMSPEQAALSGLDIDTRSDIYSLGVLLYELLTGKAPFDARSLLSAGYDEMRRIIREEEPPRPSNRLGTLLESERTELAATHRADVEKLGRLLRGDLDWIIMKALEKDRSRRYATADALALDIRRHLNDEPVEAAAPSVAYRFRKFARRNRRGLAVAATVAVLFVAGVAATAWQAVRATRANHALERQVSETSRERERAEANFLLARNAVDDYLVRVANDPRLGAGLQPLRRRLLEDAMAYYTKFLESGGDDPELVAAAFHARMRIASIQGMIGSRDEALASYREAIALLEASGNDEADREELATCHYNIGFLHLDLDRYAEAEEAFGLSRDLCESLLAEEPGNAERMADLAASLNALGITLTKSYRPREALVSLEAAVALGTRLVALRSDRADDFSNLGSQLNNLADARRMLGEEAESEALLEQAVGRQRQALTLDPQNPQYLEFLANHQFNLGIFQKKRQAPEARATLEEALAERERLVALDPAITQWQFLLARTLLELADLNGEEEAGDPEDTRGLLERTEGILRRQLEINPAWNDARSSLAECQHRLASHYRAEGRGEKALEAWRESAALSGQLIDGDPINASTHRSNRARCFYFRGQLLEEAGRDAEAIVELGRSRADYERLYGDGSRDPEQMDKLAHCLNTLGLLYRHADRNAEAENAYDRGIDLLEDLRRNAPAARPDLVLLGGIHCNKGHLLSDGRRVDDALASYALAEEVLRGVLASAPDHHEAATYLFNTVSGRSATLAGTGRVDEAVEACVRAAGDGPEAFRPGFRMRLAYYLAVAGDTARSLREVDALAGAVSPRDDTAKRDLAAVYAVNAAAVRDSDPELHATLVVRALRQLALCLGEGLFNRDAIANDPDFADLRAEPGYGKLFESPPP